MTRTITTVQELDALPVGTVIREPDYYLADGSFDSHGNVLPREEEGWLIDNCCDMHGPSGDVYLPATVLYEPGEQPRTLPHRDELAQAIASGYEPDHPVPNRHDYRAADAVLALLKETQ